MNNDATITIYCPDGSIFAEPLITKEAERTQELMQSDFAQLSWVDAVPLTIPAGAYIVDPYDGEKLTLLDPYEPSQKDEATYEYAPQFQSVVMSWGKVPFFFYTYAADGSISSREPDWTLTDNATNFMQSVCRAIKNETGESWTFEVDASLGEYVTISFTATDILSSLNAIAQEFETEWLADKATRTLKLGKAQYGTAVNLTANENIGVPSITESKESYHNRFYAFGSTRNITQDYRGANVNNLINRRLTLDPAKFPGGFIDLSRGNGEPVYPKILTFDDIYPHSGLTASNVRPRMMYRLDENKNKIQVGTDANGSPVYDMYCIWYFQTPGFTLNDSTYSADNPDGMLISGLSLSVHFTSGALTGREFELIYHPKAEVINNSDGQAFQVLAGDYEIKFVEESGYIIPAESGIVPTDGDEIILFNIRMPQEYIATAYAELEAAARKEIAERYTADLNNYAFSSNPIAFHDADPQLSIGRTVRYTNGDYSYTTRIIKLTRKLDFSFEQEITIGNERIKGNTQTLREEVVNANKDINLLAQLGDINNSLAQSYQRTQQLLIDGLARIGNMWEFCADDPTSITTRYNVLGQGEVTAYASGDGVGGGMSLGALSDVSLSGVRDGYGLIYRDGRWVAEAVSSGGIDESELAAFLSRNNYLTAAALSGYATQSWVEAKGYLTQHQSLAAYYTAAQSDGRYVYHRRCDPIDLNNITAAGLYEMYNADNRPTGDAWVKLFSWGTDDPGYNVQLATGYIGNYGMYFRHKYGGAWQGWRELLDSVNYAAYLDSRYVNKAGDTMSGSLTIANNNFLYSNHGIVAGGSSASTYLGNNNIKTLLFGGAGLYADINGSRHTLWHAGNDGAGSGLDADTLDGYHDGSVTARMLNINNVVQSSTMQFMQQDSGWNAWEAPNQNWFSVIKLNHGNGNTYYSRSIAFDFFSNRVYAAGLAGGGNLGTKTFAFLDDNVASATRLQTARSLWGNSFDGTADVSGQVKIDGSNAVGSYPGVRLHIPNVNWAWLYMNSSEVRLSSGSAQDSVFFPFHCGSFTADGSILATGEVTAYSDARGKENIEPLVNRGGARPVTYLKDGKRSIGFLAQDVQKLYPELVSDDGTEKHWLSLNYMQYTAVLQVQLDDVKSDVEMIKEKLGL